MILELQEPFKSQWGKGYLVVNPENRRNVILYNSDADRTTISYARYLMCVKLGYILSPEYEVDHKDDDKTNDHIDNLQVLTKEENQVKQHWHYMEHVQNYFGFQCVACKLPFILSERELKMRQAQTRTGLAFCSKECGRWYNPIPVPPKANSISFEEQGRIKNLREQGFTSYKISEMTGFARNTVMKYW